MGEIRIVCQKCKIHPTKTFVVKNQPNVLHLVCDNCSNEFEVYKDTKELINL